jgi:predicted TPR repeat methyltransferase
LQQGEILACLRDQVGSHDLFTAADVFVYLGDLAPVLRAMAERARPDALLVFTTEQSNGSGFTLQSNGRYAHARDYVESAARAAGFSTLECTAVELRLEHGAPVPGFCFVMRAATTAH